MAHVIARDDLLELEDRLLDEGFQFLLSILPQELFQQYNGRIIINKNFYHLPNANESPVFAFVRSQKYTCAGLEDSAGPHLDVEALQIGEAEIAAFKKIPPLTWYASQDADYIRSPECHDHTDALIKYFLLVWASANRCDSPLLQPGYNQLVAALGRLMTTRHYQSQGIIHEDEDKVDMQMNFQYLDSTESDDELQSPIKLDQNETEAGHSFGPSQETSNITNKPGKSGNSQPLIDARLPTPRRSPKEPTLDVNMVDSAGDSTRATSLASVDDSAAGAELTETRPLDTVEKLARQSLPTPDTIMEEVVVETDPTLRDLQKKLGSHTLSFLPDLEQCTFHDVRCLPPGYLNIRLLLGTLEHPPNSYLHGLELYALFKMHDKSDRAAPRMQVHAYLPEQHESRDGSLKMKDVFPYLKPCPAFSILSPGTDRAEELLLKALVKYYFIIAAKEKLLGFKKHKMPFNDSFAEQLKIAVKRLQTTDVANGEQTAQRRPYKRLKRSHDPTPTTGLSDADDDVFSFPRTRDARRSGRRTGQPSSAAVSESEDNVPALFSNLSQRIPRRLALGIPIIAGMEAPAVNELLDPEADPADSDGESGDEIPGPIPSHVNTFLQKRFYFQKQSKSHYEVTKVYAKKKEGATMGIRKVKGMLKKHEYTPDARRKATRDLTNRHVVLGAMGTHLAVREDGVTGWKKRVKDVEAQAAGISPKVLETWHALYKKDEY